MEAAVAGASLTFILFVLGAYFLPAIIAGFRGHRNFVGIMILNLFLGWTLIGWLGALIWSVLAASQPARLVETRYVEREPNPQVETGRRIAPSYKD